MRSFLEDVYKGSAQVRQSSRHHARMQHVGLSLGLCWCKRITARHKTCQLDGRCAMLSVLKRRCAQVFNICPSEGRGWRLCVNGIMEMENNNKRNEEDY